jgi:hypothetical protein
MVLQWLVGGGLVLAGGWTAIAAVKVGYRLALSHQRQLELEHAKYGPAGPPGL